VERASQKAQLLRFATFEVDLQAGELRKGGLKLKLSGQPFQVLAILLERPGDVFTREELQKRLWPDTFVDVDHNLNTAINKIREVLGDEAENPRFVETLPRRGYRFIAAVDGVGNCDKPGTIARADIVAPRRWRVLGAALLFGALTLLAGTGFLVYKGRRVPASPRQRTLTRLTFDPGLQFGATWSPDGRFIAYSSNRGGKFDIWVHRSAVAILFKSPKDEDTTGSPTGRPMANTLRFDPKTARVAFSSCPRLAVQDWKERSRLSGSTLAGPPTARRYCSS
jgi:DNA-binding winged helix-turn-helix (wHTH) protein